MFFYLTLIDTEEEKRKFVYLYENYKQTMYYTAYQILHNVHAAEDAVHQAFLRVIDHLEQVDVKIYPLGRHELLNEINRAEVFRTVNIWIRELFL